MFQVNVDLSRQVGLRLGKIGLKPQPGIRRPADDEERRRLANYWFVTVALGYQTGSIRGELGGEAFRGWDYIARKTERILERDPDFFLYKRLQTLSPSGLEEAYRDDTGRQVLDRVEERLSLLRDLAFRLEERWDGDVWNLYLASEGQVAGEAGILDLLSEFQGYRDPLDKKSHLLLLILQASEICALADPESLKVPVDNRLMRLALRTGMVEVSDPRTAEALRSGEPLSDRAVEDLRRAVQAAIGEAVVASGRSLFEMDTLFWHLGRSCCYPERPAYCGEGFCQEKDLCTFVRFTDYDSNNKCPLDGLCKGSRDPQYAAYREPPVETTYY